MSKRKLNTHAKLFYDIVHISYYLINPKLVYKERTLWTRYVLERHVSISLFDWCVEWGSSLREVPTFVVEAAINTESYDCHLPAAEVSLCCNSFKLSKSSTSFQYALNLRFGDMERKSIFTWDDWIWRHAGIQISAIHGIWMYLVSFLGSVGYNITISELFSSPSLERCISSEFQALNWGEAIFIMGESADAFAK